MASPSGNESSTNKKRLGLTFLYAALSVLLLIAAQSMFTGEGAQRSVSYSELLELVRQDKVERVELRSNNLVAALKDTEGNIFGVMQEDATAA